MAVEPEDLPQRQVRGGGGEGCSPFCRCEGRVRRQDQGGQEGREGARRRRRLPGISRAWLRCIRSCRSSVSRGTPPPSPLALTSPTWPTTGASARPWPRPAAPPPARRSTRAPRRTAA
eukprot:760870-Hanusia_phi.AAC.1